VYPQHNNNKKCVCALKEKPTKFLSDLLYVMGLEVSKYNVEKKEGWIIFDF
jgi:hypothetical protein